MSSDAPDTSASTSDFDTSISIPSDCESIAVDLSNDSKEGDNSSGDADDTKQKSDSTDTPDTTLKVPVKKRRSKAKGFLKRTKKGRQNITRGTDEQRTDDQSEDYSAVVNDNLCMDPSSATGSEMSLTESSMLSDGSENSDSQDPEKSDENGEGNLDQASSVDVLKKNRPKKRKKKIGQLKKYHSKRTPDVAVELDTRMVKDVAILVRDHNVLKESLQNTDISEANLRIVANYLQHMLEDWTVSTSGDVIFLSKIINPLNPVVERSIIWRANSLNFLVHNRQLPNAHPLTQLEMKASQRCIDVAENLILVSGEFLKYEVCSGVPTLQHLWKQFSENGEIETLLPTHCFRSSNCSFLIAFPGKCLMCRRLQKKMFEHARQKARTASRENIDRSKVNNRYLQKDEIFEKMQRIQDEKKLSQQTVRRLRHKIDQLLRKNSEKIDSELGEDFIEIMNENTDKMTAIEKLFWEQQSKALSKRGKSRTMRWHPAMIRLALHLRMLSPTAFDFLSGVISLPSARRLFDYSQFTDIQEGINEDILKEFKKIIDEKCTQEHEKYFSLLLDEMSIRSSLVYSGRTGELIGFTNLTSLEAELSSLEAEIQGKTFEKQIAKKVLVFMLSGCTTDVRFVTAVYATDSLSASQLYVRAWDVIYAVEETGAKILVVIFDGASVNRKFIRMHFNMGDKDFTYMTVNTASGEERPMYFMLDPPHLIKTFRNCFANSYSHRNSRALWKNGQKISWKAIEALFKLCQQDKYKSTKLTKAHIYLTSFSCMKVFLATQIFSYSVVQAFEKFKDLSPVKEEYSEELVYFIRLMNRCFDCLNGGVDSDKKKNNPDLVEYTSSSDPRLSFLVDDFLGYLEDWENSVASREGNFSKEQRARMIISYQSLEGMKITISSFKEIVKFTLEKGAPSLSSRRLNQDALEQRFSDYRRARGSDNNPTVKQVLHTEMSLTAQGQMTSSAKKGNTEARRREMEVDSTPLPVKKKKLM